MYRALQIFLLAVLFDGVVAVACYQLPGGISVLLRIWKELFVAGLMILYLWEVLRSGSVRMQSPRNLAIIWFLLMAIGYLGFLQGKAGETIQAIQGLRVLRNTYMFPLVFGFIVFAPHPLPAGLEVRYLRRLGLATVAVVAIGCSQWLWPDVWIKAPVIQSAADDGALRVVMIRGYFRPFATFFSPFNFGFFCALMFVLSLSYALFHRSFRGACWLICLVAGVGLLVSTVRASILGGVVGAAYLVAVRWPLLQGIGYRSFVAVCLLAGSIAIPFVVASGDEIGARGTVESAYLRAGSLAERLPSWASAWSRLRSPADFAFGLGTGAVGGSKAGEGDRTGIFEYNPVDNYYLFLLVNHGIVGLSIWALFAVQLFFFIASCLNDPPPRSLVFERRARGRTDGA